MALSPTPRGALARAFLAPQNDFTTFPAAQFQELNFYSESIERQNTLTTDAELGGARHNSGDPTDPGPGRPTVSGPVTLPQDLNQMTWWLYLAFGAPVTTDEGGGNFTHVFSSGAEDLPDFGAQFQLRADHIKKVTGLKVNELRFSTGKTEGYRQFTASLMARDAEIITALEGAGQTALPPRVKTAGTIGRCFFNDVAAGAHVGGDFTYANALQAMDFADDDGRVSRYDPGDRTVNAAPRFRMQQGAGADAILALFQDESAPFKFAVEWAVSATQSLNLTWPRAFASKVLPGASNGASIEYGATIIAAQTVGGAPAPMLTATLNNQTNITAVTG